MPASLNDQALFFSNVLSDPKFQATGVLFGTEPTIATVCHWVVIDPNRHTFRVWHKPFPGMDYRSAATSLNATAFSQGPYFRYPKLTSYAAGAKYLATGYYRELDATVQEFAPVPKPGLSLAAIQDRALYPAKLAYAAGVGLGSIPDDILGYFGLPHIGPTSARTDAAWTKTILEYKGGPPCGYAVEKGVALHTPKAIGQTPNSKGAIVNGFLARKNGSTFEDYVIGKDTPPTGCREVMGGLALGIADWDANLIGAASGAGTNQWTFWGLAELKAGLPAFDNADSKTLLNAVQVYQKAAPGKAPVTGLIFGLCSVHDNKQLCIKMLNIGIRDAVCCDTSDSAMFGGGKTILWGDAMPEDKYKSQNFGIAFFPGR